MDTVKIRELITELKREVEPKLEAIRALENLLSNTPKHEQLTITGVAGPGTTVVGDIFHGATESYVNLAVRIIAENGDAPMSVNDIVSRIRVIKGNPGIERRSVEASLYQHTKSEHPRLVKAGRGLYNIIRRFPRTAESAA